jgi:maltose alpha-D-glucosyltransferase/alpha-amylase
VWTAVLQTADHFPDGTWDPAGTARAWRNLLIDEFLGGYWAVADTAEGLGRTASDDKLMHLLLLQKAFYEIGYEMSNRPEWASIPVQGVLDLLDGGLQ